MNKPCQHIDRAIKLTLKEGNKIYHMESASQDDEKFVVDLSLPITQRVKQQIEQNCPDLRYWEWTGVPHNPAESGYTCDKCNVVLIFPNKSSLKTA